MEIEENFEYVEREDEFDLQDEAVKGEVEVTEELVDVVSFQDVEEESFAHGTKQPQYLIPIRFEDFVPDDDEDQDVTSRILHHSSTTSLHHSHPATKPPPSSRRKPRKSVKAAE